MKKEILFTLCLIVAVLMIAMRVMGESSNAVPQLPEQLLTTNIKDWQLNGVTLLLLVQVLGRAFAGLKNGGGLVGIYRGIVFGTNTPPESKTANPSGQ